MRKVIPYLKVEYFKELHEKIIFESALEYISKYNSPPSVAAIEIALEENKNITENSYELALESLSNIEKNNEAINEDWLVRATEKFCQERAIHNAILDSIHIIDGKNKNQTKGAIPDLLSKALSVSFDTNIGHDYIDDSDRRYEFYNNKEEKIPFDIDLLNKITNGGLSAKTLNVIMAGTGVGKSLAMCHMAAACLSQNLNVLYITLEMAEERIAERIDANLLNIPIQELANISKDSYARKISRLKDNVKGKLIIKEYPTSTASSIHFRNLINELALKKSFYPNILFIDYINICSSSRLKHGANVNSYSYIKAIAEELRALAIEFKIPIVSATQTTRSGFSSSDPELQDTSESFGLPATADLMLALTSTEELAALNQIMIKQLKNRYSDISKNKRFIVGIEASKMRLFDANETAQRNMMEENRTENDRKDKFKQIRVGSN